MPKYTHIMVDSETTSTENNALILTVGACVFDPDTSTIGDTFYVQLKMAEGMALGLHTSKETLDWWKRQSPEAQRSAFEEGPSTMGYAEGLQSFANWLIAIRESNERKKIQLWANDPDFDCIKLIASMKAANILPPWQYWEHKSCRTMALIAELKFNINHKTAYARAGTYHNALDDAIHQARIVSDIWQKIPS